VDTSPGTADDDLRLSHASPARDTGNLAAPGLPQLDLEGNARVVGGAVDLGAYEFPVVCRPVWYVDADASGGDSGLSWHDAFQDLPSGLATAGLCGPGTEVWVAAGTYTPTEGSDRTISFVIPSGVILRGGFQGSTTAPSVRMWRTYRTILSGDIGIPAQTSDNSYRVLTATGTAPGTTLDGVYIEGGQGSSRGVESWSTRDTWI